MINQVFDTGHGTAFCAEAERLLAALEFVFDTCRMATERPTWWRYPTRCHHGHEWGPGLVTVGWSPCECPEAQAEDMGHLWVRCHAVPGCSSIWYRPEHSPAAAQRLPAGGFRG
jgi:hypothetical protein